MIRIAINQIVLTLELYNKVLLLRLPCTDGEQRTSPKTRCISLPASPSRKRCNKVFLCYPPGDFFFSNAQCSICAKTAQQLGEKPAKALDTGIVYLAFASLAITGFIGYQR